MALTGAAVKSKGGLRPRKATPKNASAEESIAASTSTYVDQNLTDETVEKNDGKATPRYSPDITDFREVPVRTKITPKSAKRRKLTQSMNTTRQSPASVKSPDTLPSVTLNLESTEGANQVYVPPNNLSPDIGSPQSMNMFNATPTSRNPNRLVSKRAKSAPKSAKRKKLKLSVNTTQETPPTAKPSDTLPSVTLNLGSTKDANLASGTTATATSGTGSTEDANQASKTPTNTSPDIIFVQNVIRFAGTPTGVNPTRGVSGRNKRPPNSAKRIKLNSSLNTTQDPPPTVGAPETLRNVILNPIQSNESATPASGTPASDAGTSVNPSTVSTPEKKIDKRLITPPNSPGGLPKSTLASFDLSPPPPEDPPATVKSPETLSKVMLNPGFSEGANQTAVTTASAAGASVNQFTVSTPEKKVDQRLITPPNSHGRLPNSLILSTDVSPPPPEDPLATVDPSEVLPIDTLNLGSTEGANHSSGTTGGAAGTSVNPFAVSTQKKKVVKRPITPPNSLGRLPKSPFASIDWSPPPPEETRVFLGQLVEYPFTVVGSPTVSSIIDELKEFVALRSGYGARGFSDFLVYIFETCCRSYPATLREQADHAMQQQGTSRYSDVCHFTGFARLLQMIKSSVHPSTREEEKEGLPTFVCRSFEPASTFLVQYTVHRKLFIAVFQYFRDVHQIEIPVYEGDENNFRINSMFK